MNDGTREEDLTRSMNGRMSVSGRKSGCAVKLPITVMRGHAHASPPLDPLACVCHSSTKILATPLSRIAYGPTYNRVQHWNVKREHIDEKHSNIPDEVVLMLSVWSCSVVHHATTVNLARTCCPIPALSSHTKTALSSAWTGLISRSNWPGFVVST